MENPQNMDTDLFREAEDFIKNKMSGLFGIGSACGIATQDMAHKAAKKYTFDDEDEVGVRLNWRTDPRTSMSDWILAVKDGKKSQIYHVHTAILIQGGRKSGLLLKLFETLSQREEEAHTYQKNVSEIYVDSYSAPFVPLLLDYIYADKLDLDTTVAPVLRRLANQFDVRSLYALVSSFIQQDLSPKTAARYLEQAELANDKELSEIALLLAIQSFDVIPGDELGRIPPPIFQQMISNKSINVPTPERLSQRIAAYIRARRDNDDAVDSEMFFFLTHANVIPSIHDNEAMWFLSYAEKAYPGALDDEGDGGYESTLQHRCAVASSKNWKKNLIVPIQMEVKRMKDGVVRDGSDDEKKYRLFRDGAEIDKNGRAYLALPDHLKVEILQMALLEANIDHLGVERQIVMKKQARSEVVDSSTVRQRGKDLRQSIDNRSAYY